MNSYLPMLFPSNILGCFSLSLSLWCLFVDCVKGVTWQWHKFSSLSIKTPLCKCSASTAVTTHESRMISYLLFWSKKDEVQQFSVHLISFSVFRHVSSTSQNKIKYLWHRLKNTANAFSILYQVPLRRFSWQLLSAWSQRVYWWSAGASSCMSLSL